MKSKSLLVIFSLKHAGEAVLGNVAMLSWVFLRNNIWMSVQWNY